MQTLPRARAPALETIRVNLIVGRAEARLSQHDLAKRAGVSRPTISRLERGVGDVGVDVLQRIADALGVDVAALFVPPVGGRVDDDELARRAAAPADEFIDAQALLATVDEAASTPVDRQRYSRAGRPSVAR